MFIIVIFIVYGIKVDREWVVVIIYNYNMRWVNIWLFGLSFFL